jgi:hypothetical protein
LPTSQWSQVRIPPMHTWILFFTRCRRSTHAHKHTYVHTRTRTRTRTRTHRFTHPNKIDRQTDRHTHTHKFNTYWRKNGEKEGTRISRRKQVWANPKRTCSLLTTTPGMGWETIMGCRQFFYVRYIDWGVTLPLLILALGMLAGQDLVTVAAVAGASMMMVTAGYLGSVALVATVKWLWFMISLLVFVPVVFAIVRVFRQSAIGACATPEISLCDISSALRSPLSPSTRSIAKQGFSQFGLEFWRKGEGLSR